MLYTLLTLLLPYRATPFELEFHTEFVLRAYREYYECLAATGLRDRKVLAQIKKKSLQHVHATLAAPCHLD